MMVTINVHLPDELTEQARSLGLLTDENLAEMIRAEIRRKRQAAWTDLQEMLEPVQADFRAEYSDLNDHTFMEMVQSVVLEVREEIYREQTDDPAPRESDS